MTHLRELAIAIPSNILEDCQSLSDKTNKIGVIARAASIFKVSKIHVYKNKGISDTDLILLLLRYLVTPQYLRKNIFPIKKELKLAGTLPPLRIPSHTVNRQYDRNIVDIRDGLCIKFDKKFNRYSSYWRSNYRSAKRRIHRYCSKDYKILFR